jgi:hypothetical protein
MQSKIIAKAFVMAPEIERELIAQGTRKAFQAKKVAGARLEKKREVRTRGQGLAMPKAQGKQAMSLEKGEGRAMGE